MAITHLIPAGSNIVEATIVATVAEAEAAYPGYRCIDGDAYPGAPGFLFVLDELVPPLAPWRPATAVVEGGWRANAGNAYRAAVGGVTGSGDGPMTTDPAIVDGDAVWQYGGRYA